ncbi:MAG: tripartite tricarboxylate transporter substrate binding protein [Oscillospiraceae bacterium]
MNKKVLALLLTLCMTAIFLVGCGGGDTTSSAAPETSAPESTAPETSVPESTAPEVNYPTGDITFIIPNGAGGGNDLITRALVPSLTETLGVNVIPANQSESAGAVAAMNLMTADPNGETLYFNSQTLITASLSTIKSIDLTKFQPVAQVVEDTGNLLVRTGEYADMDAFVADANARTLKIAVNSETSVWGLAARQLANTLGVEFQYVIYSEGGSACLAALAQGEVDATIENVSGSQAMVDSGNVVPLACLGEERVSAYPDTPTLLECGINMTHSVWRGVFTTAGVSEEILDQMDKAFAAAVESDTFKDYCANASLTIHYRNHKEFTEFFNEQVGILTDMLAQ